MEMDKHGLSVGDYNRVVGKGLVLVLRFPKSLPWIAVLTSIRSVGVPLVDTLNLLDSAFGAVTCVLLSFLHLVEGKTGAFLLIHKRCLFFLTY